jgi:hypothetical protein
MAWIGSIAWWELSLAYWVKSPVNSGGRHASHRLVIGRSAQSRPGARAPWRVLSTRNRNEKPTGDGARRTAVRKRTRRPR